MERKLECAFYLFRSFDYNTRTRSRSFRQGRYLMRLEIESVNYCCEQTQCDGQNPGFQRAEIEKKKTKLKLTQI